MQQKVYGGEVPDFGHYFTLGGRFAMKALYFLMGFVTSVIAMAVVAAAGALTILMLYVALGGRIG